MYRPGEILGGKYRILRLIGRGGMAEVYAAHHELLHQTVAIKMLLPTVAASPEASSRFLNEARAAARVRGEHVATVMDVGSLSDGTAFMVLEYLEGHDLDAYVTERGPLPPAEAVDYVLEALQALAQAHALGIVHRDLKPSNLFRARQPDGSSIVKVLDFGISKVTRSTSAGYSTATSAILGSPFYMAPEQARSAKTVDARADIWAIGVILYKLLAGFEPLRGDSMTDILLAIVQDEPKPLREVRPDVPEGLEAVVVRCLQKKPDQRFPNIGELAAALAPHGGPDAAREAQRIERTLAAPAPESVALPEAPPAIGTRTMTLATKVEGQGKAVAAAATPSPGPRTTSSWANAGEGAGSPRRGSKARLVVAGGVVAIALAAAAGVSSLRGKPAVSAPASPAIAPEPGPTVPPSAVVVEPAAAPVHSVVADPEAGAVPSASASASTHRSSAPARPPAPASAAAPAPKGAAPDASFDFLNQRN
jgi:serine/threonine-protein kinase